MKRHKERILTILKFRRGYEHTSNYSYGNYFSSGLYWSAKFVVDMLAESGVHAKLVQVVDNNDIDREVAEFRPTVVIIEALWVVPEKFDILKKLHPHVRWIVRLHSNIPFLASEGIAISWIKEYARRGVEVAVNEERALHDVREILRLHGLEDKVLYLPNYYPVEPRSSEKHNCSCCVRIGCYGAIRPLKNQLIQAIAAIQFAESEGRKLHFHINATRVELGEGSLENIRALFRGTRHALIEDTWMSHHQFLKSLRHLDIGMQASLSETFSIVAADMINVGIPVVVSPEVKWASSISKVNPTDSSAIAKGLKKVLTFDGLDVILNRKGLKDFSRLSKEIWLYNFKEE